MIASCADRNGTKITTTDFILFSDFGFGSPGLSSVRETAQKGYIVLPKTGTGSGSVVPKRSDMEGSVISASSAVLARASLQTQDYTSRICDGERSTSKHAMVSDAPRWMHAHCDADLDIKRSSSPGNYGVLIDELLISSEVGGDWTKVFRRSGAFRRLYGIISTEKWRKCRMTKTAECS